MLARHLARYLGLCCGLGLLLVAPQQLAAQQGVATPLSVIVTSDRLMAELPCPAAAVPAATVDGTPVVITAREAAPAPPVALTLVIDTRQAMAAVGTPHSTRLADATLLATGLLDRAPPGSLVTLVSYDLGARVIVPLTADIQVVRRALTGLAPLSLPAAAQGDVWAEALRLALEELQAAPPGPRVIAAYVSDEPVQLPAQLLDGQDRLLVVSHAAASEDETGNDGPVLPFVTASSAELPGRFEAYDRRAAALLGTERARLTIPVANLAAGAHQLAVEGCGALATAAFELRPGPLAAFGPGAAALGACGVAALIWRKRRPADRARPRTQRLAARPRVTTARRITDAGPERVLRLAVWEGDERRVVALAGRQSTVGRDAGCEIVIANAWASGLHARLTRSGDEVEITDLGSTNGTCLGAEGRRLAAGAPEPLAPGELVLIGPEVRLCLLTADEAHDDFATEELL